MTPAALALIAELEASARSAWQAEESLRAKMAEQVALLERRRAFAYRRTNLVRTLAAAASTIDAEEAAMAAQRAAVRDELAWEVESEFYRAILDRLRPVGHIVWQCVRGKQDVAPSAIHAELERFESWFESTHGQSFYALFDRDAPEVALVET